MDYVYEELVVEATNSNKYPNKQFGYERSVLMGEIRQQMISEGYDKSSASIYFDAIKRYENLLKDNLTMTQRQDLGKWLGLGWAGGSSTKTKSNKFTDDELLFIQEKLVGCNEPVGVEILNKIKMIRK